MSHTQHNRPAAHSGNRARAIWKSGALPEEHRWAWQLVVTVEQPEFGIILDCGKVLWKGTVCQVDQSVGPRSPHSYIEAQNRQILDLRDSATGLWKRMGAS
ncbi:hypothetical protein [Bifidobacterium sp. ESL0819]|uniref:hypothetical protein n=1 Tax=Bifidobacterium sp. ESL0819 TaxID=3448589 RepID=UPI004041ACA6